MQRDRYQQIHGRLMKKYKSALQRKLTPATFAVPFAVESCLHRSPAYKISPSNLNNTPLNSPLNPLISIASRSTSLVPFTPAMALIDLESRIPAIRPISRSAQTRYQIAAVVWCEEVCHLMGSAIDGRYERAESLGPRRARVVPDVDLLDEVLAVCVAEGVDDEGGCAA